MRKGEVDVKVSGGIDVRLLIECTSIGIQFDLGQRLFSWILYILRRERYIRRIGCRW